MMENQVEKEVRDTKVLADKLWDQMVGVETQTKANQAVRTMVACSNGIMNVMRFEAEQVRTANASGVETPVLKAVLVGKQGS